MVVVRRRWLLIGVDYGLVFVRCCLLLFVVVVWCLQAIFVGCCLAVRVVVCRSLVFVVAEWVSFGCHRLLLQVCWCCCLLFGHRCPCLLSLV